MPSGSHDDKEFVSSKKTIAVGPRPRLLEGHNICRNTPHISTNRIHEYSKNDLLPRTPSTPRFQTLHHEACDYLSVCQTFGQAPCLTAVCKTTCSRMPVATMCESTWKAVEVVRFRCRSKSFQVFRSHLAGCILITGGKVSVEFPDRKQA